MGYRQLISSRLHSNERHPNHLAGWTYILACGTKANNKLVSVLILLEIPFTRCRKRVVLLLTKAIIMEERLKERSDKINLLDAYSKFLEKQGYLDTDWWSEEPNAIEEFLNTQD